MEEVEKQKAAGKPVPNVRHVPPGLLKPSDMWYIHISQEREREYFKAYQGTRFEFPNRPLPFFDVYKRQPSLVAHEFRLGMANGGKPPFWGIIWAATAVGLAASFLENPYLKFINSKVILCIIIAYIAFKGDNEEFKYIMNPPKEDCEKIARQMYELGEHEHQNHYPGRKVHFYKMPEIDMSKYLE